MCCVELIIKFFAAGYKAYVGFLHLNHAYNNPVVHAFIQLLSKQSPQRTAPYSAAYSSLAPDSNMRLLDHWDTKDYRGLFFRDNVCMCVLVGLSVGTFNLEGSRDQVELRILMN